MKPKKLLSIVLLAFVAVSIVYMVWSQNSKSATNVTATDNQTKVVAYYFHGNMRCNTCKTIEAYAKEAIETGFANEMNKGKIEFRTVNTDVPGNEHYIQDYQLTTKSVVVVQYVKGEQKSWKNLERVWELVPEKEKYVDYIQTETRGLLASI